MMNLKKFFHFNWLRRISPGYHGKVQSRRKQMAFQAEFFRRWELAQKTMRLEYENLHSVSRQHDRSLKELQRQIQEICQTVSANSAALNNALAETGKTLAAQQNETARSIAEIKSGFKLLEDKLTSIGSRPHFFDDILENLKDAAEMQSSICKTVNRLAEGQKEMTDKLVFIGNRTHFFDDILKNQKDVADMQSSIRKTAARLAEGQKEMTDKLVFIGNRTHFFDDILKNQKGVADMQSSIRKTADRLAEAQKEMTDKLVFIGNRTHFFDSITEQLQNLEQFRQTLHQQYESLFRNEIQIRWQMLDALEPLLFPPDTRLACPICGHAAARKDYQTVSTMCKFSGGLLERFVCPECGVIFGPLKMMMLKPGQLAEEYRQSYTTYSESDCTALEENIFRDLNPVKEGIYLNYGAGAWNSTSEKLRQEGFTVYDYEPYAPAADRDNLIRDPEQLRDMKFDGIFSNDLLEHLPDPVNELKFMSAMLKPGGCMIHGSGCYEYAFEYTRFHLFFFVGKSLEYISRDAGLKYSLGERVYSYSPFRKCKFTQA